MMVPGNRRGVACWTSAALTAALVVAGCDRAAEPPPASVAATATSQAQGTGAAATQAGAEAAATAEGGPRRTVTADGRLVQPLEPQTLTFAASGTLTELLVEPGQPVDAGQVVARIDPGPLDLAVADARAAVAQSQAALRRQETGGALETARIDVERAKNQLWGIQAQRDAVCGAYEKGQKEGGFAKLAAPSSAECDGAQANVQAAEQGVKLAEAQVRAAEAAADTDLASARAAAERARLALAQALGNRAAAELRAPVAGTIAQVHLLLGLPAGPGVPVATLAPEGPLQFVTDNLSERDVAEVEPGSMATITLTAFADTPIEALVGRISDVGAVSPEGVVVFTAYLHIVDDAGLPLRAGMTGRTDIELPTE